ncbi:MAG: CBS domain-containing protein [Cyanobacteria bacterium SBLK]|nr:CBS domain-containing protein [Cyanobacteria bacterium SBLK]
MDVSTLANPHIYLPQLEDILQREVLALSPDLTLLQVLAALTQNAARAGAIATAKDETGDILSSHCAIIVENERPVGIVTERDIIRRIAREEAIENYPAREAMTAHPIVLAESEFTNVFAIVELMQRHRIRHLPVTDDGGCLKGLITPESLRWVLQPVNLLRMRLLSEVMSREVITATPTTTVLELAKQMSQYRISCIVIARETPTGTIPLGIVTEWDIVQYKVLELPLEGLQASQVMSAPLLTLTPEMPLWEAHRFLQSKRIRRVVIVDEGGFLQGLVTQTSILHSLSSLDLYSVVQTLQQKVHRLEREKQEMLEGRTRELEVQVSERTQELQARARQIQLVYQRERIIAEIARDIRQSLDLQEILDATVKNLGTFLGVDRVIILKFDAEWHGEVVAEYTEGPWKVLLGRTIYDPCFAPDWVNAYRQGRIRVVDDVEQIEMSDCHREFLAELQVRGKILVPIVLQETDPESEGKQSPRLWGILSVNQCGIPRQWQPFESELLEDLATQVAIAIQQSELYQRARADLAERQRVEMALRNLVTGTANAVGRDFFPALVRHLAEALAVRMAVVTRYENGQIEVLASWIDGRLRSLPPLAPETCPCGRVLAEGSYFCEEGMSKDYPDIAAALPFTPEGYLGLALSNSKEEPIGTLAIVDDNVLSDRQHRQGILRVFAARAAAELERQAATQRLQALNQTLEYRVSKRTSALQQSLQTLSNIKYALDRFAIIAITDPQGTIIEVNDKFCEISGYEREELLGQTHKIVNSGYHPQEFFAWMWETIQTGRVWRGEIQNRAKSGREYWVNTTIVPFFNEDGELFQYLAIRTDITEQKKSAEAISQLLQQEKELNELKSRFITTASHEFRTPLALISSSTGILQDYGDRLAGVKKAKHLGRIQGAVKQMTQLLEDVLTVDLVAEDRLLFQPASVNLIEFCGRLQEEFARSHPQRQIDWQIEPPEPSNRTIQADAKLLHQIFSNLLSNALKYSPDDRPVECCLTYHAATVVFVVRDRGIGIPAADRERLFESFHRADNVGTIQGTGLGLAIVKKCVDLHGGTIGIESRENSGTAVTVELPITLGEEKSHG